MRKNILFLLLLIIVCSKNTIAQDWIEHHNENCNVAFSLPTDALIIDSLHTTMYSSEVDSFLSVQVHLFDSAYLNADEALLSAALEENEGDTLRAIAQLFLYATNSELLSLEEVANNMGDPGLEIGLDYLTLQSDFPTLTFIRYFLFNHKFIAFSITGSEDDVPRLMSYKDLFFDSINFY